MKIGSAPRMAHDIPERKQDDFDSRGVEKMLAQKRVSFQRQRGPTP
jgi:hypothetical protein